ncbi:MAG TPA: ABC transporter permease [Chloroflexota bacterium]|jgi:peptide/nickel transport system permease protein|nr:ABC transporter permease [Chloroflexota bacterium]
MAAPARTLELGSPWLSQEQSRRINTVWRLARQKYLGAISLVVLLVFVFTAAAATFVAPYDPVAVDTAISLQAPSATHLFGTDELGRDLFSRVIYGARISLLVGLGSVAIGVLFGVFLGITSAYFGGRYDLIVQRFIDALQSFPSLVLAMVIVATLGSSVFHVTLAIAITMIATKTRVIRGAALSLKQNSYVEAARVIGASHAHIMLRYILPNAWAPIIVLASATLGQAIIREASLSFLGLGPPPPNPTWGGMLSGSARSFMSTAQWMVIFPGLAITTIVLAFNLLGDTIRDVMDPRLKHR